MNYYLIEMMSGKKILHIPESQALKVFPIDSYLVIGSTITFYSLDHLTVWGSGIINANKVSRIKGRPNKICAVRGPLTREVLVNKGYECPEVYGDPILLLPRFYKPENREKKYEFGIVPHFIDKEAPVVREMAKRGALIIDVQNYSRWQDFVDQICSCQYILSSSLHGLICAEAYGVPSVWAGFSNYIDGWEFKFQDFYLSINKPGITMEIINRIEDIDMRALSKLESWSPGEIDLDKLLEACPFELSKDLKQVR